MQEYIENNLLNDQLEIKCPMKMEDFRNFITKKGISPKFIDKCIMEIANSKKD